MSRFAKLETLANNFRPAVPDLQKKTIRELLVLHADIESDLRRRKVLRSANNLTGDLAEYLFCNAFGWELCSKSEKGFDAISHEGEKIQIKGRRFHRHRKNASRQLSALRDFKAFDVLAATLLRDDYRVERAALIPVSVVRDCSKFHKHTNSYRFLLRDSIWDQPGVADVTDGLRLVEERWTGLGA